MAEMSTWKKTKQKRNRKLKQFEVVGGSIDAPGAAQMDQLERVLRAMGDDPHTVGRVREEARALELSLDKQLPCRGRGCPGPEPARAAREACEEDQLMAIMVELCVHCRALLHAREVVALLEHRAEDVGLPSDDPPYDDDAIGDDCPICRELGIQP